MPSARAVLVITAVACLLASSACDKLAMEKRSSRPFTSAAYSIQADESSGSESGNRASARLVSAQTPSTTPRKIIRNGSLEIVVAEIDQAIAKIRSIVDGLGGFVEKSSQTNVGGHTATVTVRVPANSLDRAMTQIKEMASSVDREGIDARDVTRDYVDLDARLRNAKAEEGRYLEILKKATTIKDTLDGAEKLSNVRGRIEQLQGEMNYLTSQIDMSALEISLQTEAGSTILGVKWRPFHQAKIALGEMISGLADWADAVIAFFINLPLILVWTASVIALLFVALRVLVFSWKKLGPKTNWTWPKFLSRNHPGAS
jgi:hypothetical protein